MENTLGIKRPDLMNPVSDMKATAGDRIRRANYITSTAGNQEI